MSASHSLDSNPWSGVKSGSMPKASSEGSTVLTIALGIVLTILQPQRGVNSYNFDALDFDPTTGSNIESKLDCLNIAFPRLNI